MGGQDSEALRAVSLDAMVNKKSALTKSTGSKDKGDKEDEEDKEDKEGEEKEKGEKGKHVNREKEAQERMEKVRADIHTSTQALYVLRAARHGDDEVGGVARKAEEKGLQDHLIRLHLEKNALAHTLANRRSKQRDQRRLDRAIQASFIHPAAASL